MSDDEEKGGAPGAGMTAKLSARLKKFEDRLLKLASNPVAAAPAAEKLANLLAKRPEAAPHVSAAARAALKQVQREAASVMQGASQATIHAATVASSSGVAASAGPTSLQASPTSTPKRKAGGITADVSAGVVSLGSLAGLPKPPKAAGRSASKPASGGSGGILSLGPETPAEAMRRQERAGRFEAEELARHQGPEFVAPPPVPAQQQQPSRCKNINSATTNRKRSLNPLQYPATGVKRGRNHHATSTTSGIPASANETQTGDGADGGEDEGGDEEEEAKWAKTAVVGTCVRLEKSYLRLTSAPRPELVRPEPVLEQALAHVQSRWRQAEEQYHHNNSSSQGASYREEEPSDGEGDEESRGRERSKAAAWCDDQLKAIRQDMVVQHLKSPLVVKVYETHARISLESGDLTSFGACLARLSVLHSTTLGRQVGSCDEFFAYRILHALVRGTPGEVLSADLRRLVEGKGKAQTKSSSEGSANAGGSLAGVVCDNSAASFIAKVSLGPILIGERDGSPTSGTGNGGGGGDEKSGKKKNAKKKQKKKGKEKPMEVGIQPGITTTTSTSLSTSSTSTSTSTSSSKKWTKSSSSEKRKSAVHDNDAKVERKSCWSKWAGPATVHAIEVTFAYRAGLYTAFFDLYRQAPFMSGYLMDALLPQARLRALHTLAKAYAPMPLPVLHVHRALGFDGGIDAAAPIGYEGAEDISGTMEFLRSHGTVVVEAPVAANGGTALMMDTKATKQLLFS